MSTTEKIYYLFLTALAIFILGVQLGIQHGQYLAYCEQHLENKDKGFSKITAFNANNQQDIQELFQDNDYR